MFSKPLAVALLAVGCVTAAAGGAYVAVRQNAAQPVETAAAPTAPQPTASGEAGVAETEAVVTPALPPPAVALEASVPPPAPRSVTRPSKPRVERTATRPVSARRENRVSAPTASKTTAPAEVASIPPQPATHPDPGPVADPVEAPRAQVPPPAPVPVFEELIVPADAVVGLQVDSSVSTERARVEDRVEARVTRDVTVDGRTAIPAGSRALGTVTLVEPGGKMKERARLGVRFHSLVLADGTEVPIRTEAIFREGDSPSGESARKIGGAAVGGAIIGAIIGGKKGAVVGGATGAAGGTAVVMAGDRNHATLPAGTVVTIRLSAPVVIEVEKQPRE